MSVRVKRWPNTVIESKEHDTDTTQSQREVTKDGYTYHFGPNEVKNFMDDGVGAAVAAFAPGSDIVEDQIPSGGIYGGSRSQY